MENIVRIVSVRYQFSHFFPLLLKRLIEKTPEGKIRKVLIDNLEEELGESTKFPGFPHEQERKILLEAIGVNYQKWKPKGDLDNLHNIDSEAICVINGFKELIDRHYLIGTSAIAYSESAVPLQFSFLLFMLKLHHPQLTEQQLHHLTSHIQHDVMHAEELTDILVNERNQELVLKGRNASYQLWNKFWLGFV